MGSTEILRICEYCFKYIQITRGSMTFVGTALSLSVGHCLLEGNYRVIVDVDTSKIISRSQPPKVS